MIQRESAVAQLICDAAITVSALIIVEYSLYFRLGMGILIR